MSELLNYIETYFEVNKYDAEKITSFFTLTTLDKGEYFLKADRYADKLGFVQSGFMREYLLKDSKEVTKWIAAKGYFTTDIAAFMFQKTAKYNIQALVDTALYVMNRKDYEKINEIIPTWPALEKLFLAKCFGILEDRIVQQIALSADERYQQLMQHNSKMFKLVPLQHIASMLGITPETLSRLRKKVFDIYQVQQLI